MPGATPPDSGNSLSISLEGCTPAKMAAGAAAPKAHTFLKMKQTACTSTEKRGLSFL